MGEPPVAELGELINQVAALAVVVGEVRYLLWCLLYAMCVWSGWVLLGEVLARSGVNMLERGDRR